MSVVSGGGSCVRGAIRVGCWCIFCNWRGEGSFTENIWHFVWGRGGSPAGSAVYRIDLCFP